MTKELKLELTSIQPWAKPNKIIMTDNKINPWEGTGVALVTPFLNGNIDFENLTKIINHVIDGGVDFLVSLGTTGETATLSDEEIQQVIAHTISVNKGRVPLVIGNFGGNNTLELAQKLRNTDFDGISALLCSSPSYLKPTQEGIYRHYMELAEASPLPIIIYNVPSRTASNVEAETTIRLAAASEKFVAIKEASGDLYQSMYIIQNCRKDFNVLSGDDPTALPIIASGGKGVISVIANALPLEMSSLVDAALEDDFEKARKINGALLEMYWWLFCEGNPVGIKSIMHHLGLCKRDVRLPLVPMSEANYKGIPADLKLMRGDLKSIL